MKSFEKKRKFFKLFQSIGLVMAISACKVPQEKLDLDTYFAQEKFRFTFMDNPFTGSMWPMPSLWGQHEKGVWKKILSSQVKGLTIGQESHWIMPLMLSDGFYVVTDERLAAFSLNGQLQWKAYLIHPDEKKGPRKSYQASLLGSAESVLGGGIAASLDEKTIYIATSDGYLGAFSSAGKRIWFRKDPGILYQKPLFFEWRQKKYLALSSQEDALILMDAENGQILWRKKNLEGQLKLAQSILPIAKNGILFYPESPDVCGAYSVSNGQSLWSCPVGEETLEFSPFSHQLNEMTGLVSADSPLCFRCQSGDPTEESASFSNGIHPCLHFYSGTYNGQFSCFNGRGQLCWSLPLATMSPPVIAKGAIFLVTRDQKFYGLDQATGKIFWKMALDCLDKKEGNWRILGIYKGAITLFHHGGTLVFLDPVGQKILKTFSSKRLRNCAPFLWKEKIWLFSHGFYQLDWVP